MGIRNAIRQSSTPAFNDLEGWKARVEYLDKELKLALEHIEILEPSEDEEDFEIPFEDDDDASA